MNIIQIVAFERGANDNKCREHERGQNEKKGSLNFFEGANPYNGAGLMRR